MCIRDSLSSPNGSGRSLAAKRFLVHFEHYFNRERIENQISNSKIGVLIYNNTYRMKSRTQQSQFATWNDQIAKKFHVRTVGGWAPRPCLRHCSMAIMYGPQGENGIWNQDQFFQLLNTERQDAIRHLFLHTTYQKVVNERSWNIFGSGRPWELRRGVID